MGQDKKSKKKVSKLGEPSTTNNPDLTAEIINNTAINSAISDSSSSADYGTMSDYGSGGDFGTFG